MPAPPPAHSNSTYLLPLRRDIRLFKWLTVGALLTATAAIIVAVLALTGRRLGSVEATHLTIRPTDANKEAILVDFGGVGEASFSRDAAGLRVLMPTANGPNTTSQAGVVVVGGQAAVSADGPVLTGLSVTHPAASTSAVWASGLSSGSFIVDSHTSVL